MGICAVCRRDRSRVKEWMGRMETGRADRMEREGIERLERERENRGCASWKFE